MKPFVIAALLMSPVLALHAPRAAAAAEVEPLKLGVRCDAPPFSFETGGKCADSGETVAAHDYDGYMVKLCQTAAELLGRPTKLVAVDATSRLDLLKDGRVDLLCEPTTVTLDRLDVAAYSQIVFVSGISYVYLPDGRSDAAGQPTDLTVHVGYLEGTTAAEIIDSLTGQGIFGTDAVTRKPYERHTAGVRDICTGKIDFYVGDRDIILRLMQNMPGCKAIASRKFFSREPYAIAVSRDQPELAIDLQRVLFHMFAKGELRRLFAKHFADKTPSPILESLFVSQDVSRGIR